ncbi:MAG: hypothetical protein IJU23_13315 [Proteobacteria bacterium]|nr:hypothetical protein [Pseudomonadota bacterium]
MNDILRRRLALACCAAMALAVSSCGDDSGSSSQKCGDQVCTELQKCVDDVCKDLCGTEVCADDKVCDDATQTCIDKPVDPCSLCTETQKCVDKVCKDLCGTEVCADDKVCDEATQTCIDKVVDPCTTVNCLANQTCMNARCYDDGCLITGEDGSISEKTCDEGQECSKGQCIDSLCKTLKEPCADGWQCIKGICEETACLTQHCGEGQSCRGGKCLDNECLDMTCNDDKVCSKGNCLYPACVDKEACATGKTCNEEGTCVYIAAPAISLDEPSDKSSDEKGKTVSLALHLNNAPTKDVRITCEIETTSKNKEVEVACDAIVFNTNNWQLEQTIVVTGVDDNLIDGNQTYKIKVTTVSEDKDFDGLTAESVELTNIDTTKAGIVVSETTLMTYEDPDAAPATFTVVLSSKPSADVVLTLEESSKGKECTLSPTTLTFTPDNWNVPQTVTATGVDDEIDDGNVSYKIYFAPADSTDPNYDNIQGPTIKATNVDNDVAGISMNLAAEDFEIDEGQNYPLTVKLNTKPENDVKISISADDDTEAEFDVAELTIKAEDWNKGTEIQLMVVVDHIIDGDQPVKLTFAVTSEDKDYNFNSDYTGTVKDVDIADLILSTSDSPNVREGSDEAITLSLALSSKPAHDVTVDITVGDDTEIKVDKTSLTISPDKWNELNEVHVNSVDDVLVDGDIKSNVTIKLASDDTHFAGVSKDVEFTTLDNDEAGFVVTSTAATYAENSGATDSMTVALKAQPTENVTVTVASSDSTELAVTSDATLTFTADNWNTPQTVNVKVVDDNLADGQQTAYVSFTGASSDEKFNDIKGQSATFTIVDNDSATVVLSAGLKVLGTSSPNSTATLSLGAEPLSDVVLTLKADHPDIITFDPPQLTFTSTNWNTPQTVIVHANFDALDYATLTENIWAVASGDVVYADVQSKPEELTLIKISSVQDFLYTGAAQLRLLPIGNYMIEVWGAQGGGSYGNGTWRAGTGMGGYSVGTLTLDTPTNVYIYVGGKGEDANLKGIDVAGGFNGGGGAVGDSDSDKDDGGGGGGGASDVRIATNSLYSRVIVAGGGGGNGFSTAYKSSIAGHGGGLSGTPESIYPSEPGTISSGHAFGVGGVGEWTSGGVEGGGGGGWYGGTHGVTSNCGAGGSGGSGWLYTAENYTTWQSGNPTDASQYTLNSSHYLRNSQTIAGNASMPAPGGGTEMGHPNNGFVRITLQ